jgi:hypothetical protein
MPWGARHGPLEFLYGGMSHTRPLLGPSESMQDGISGINPRQ